MCRIFSFHLELDSLGIVNAIFVAVNFLFVIIDYIVKILLIQLQFHNATPHDKRCVVACCHMTWLDRRLHWTESLLLKCYRRWSICLPLIAVSAPDSSYVLCWNPSATHHRFRPRCLALTFARVCIMCGCFFLPYRQTY